MKETNNTQSKEKGLYITLPITLQISFHPEDFDTEQEYQEMITRSVKEVLLENTDFFRDSIGDLIYNEITTKNNKPVVEII